MARPLRLDRLTGRPSRYSLQAAAEILGRMCLGEPLYLICRAEHLPADSTVRGWADSGKYPEFTKAFERAKKQQATVWAEQVVGISDEIADATSLPEVYAAQTRIRARMWAAAKFAPADFGDRVIMPPSGGAQIHVYLPAKNTPVARVIDGQAGVLGAGDQDGECPLTAVPKTRQDED